MRQSAIFPGAGSQSGTVDIVQSLFFSPKEPVNGWIVGAGPVFLLPAGMSMTLQTESTYDWENENWTVPVAVLASKVMAIGKQPVSVGGGIRYYIESPDSGPEGLAFRVFITLLFPK